MDDVAGDQLPVVARVGGHLLLGDVGAVADGEHVLGLTALQEQGGSDLESVVEVDLRRICRERGKELVLGLGGLCLKGLSLVA